MVFRFWRRSRVDPDGEWEYAIIAKTAYDVCRLGAGDEGTDWRGGELAHRPLPG